MSILQQQRGSGIQICRMAGLFAFMMALLFALALMGGCRATAANANDADGAAQGTIPIEDTSGEGFVIEDSAVVYVDIDEEGE